MIRVPILSQPEDAFSHTHSLRVLFGDTDAAQIVYYANYFRYFEAGRAELLRAADLPYATLVGDQLFMPVVEAWSRYRASAKYDDLLQVRSWVHEVRSASILIAHQVYRDHTLLCEGAARLGCLDHSGRPRRVPAALKRFKGAPS